MHGYIFYSFAMDILRKYFLLFLSRKRRSKNTPWKEERYVFVSITQLMMLLSVCHLCSAPATVSEECDSPFLGGTLFMATMVKVVFFRIMSELTVMITRRMIYILNFHYPAFCLQVCSSCNAVRQWSNQLFLRKLPVLNLQLSSAILLSGRVLSKVLRMFEFLNVSNIA